MKFINWHMAAIKAADPEQLVTVGAWNIHSLTDNYSDARTSKVNKMLINALI